MKKAKEVRILLLEDNSADAELAVRELASAGFLINSRRVETEETFLEQIETFHPDVVLSDYSLPRFDGLTALGLLKDRKIDIPFILCTGTLNEETAVKCMKKGAFDYLLKTSLKRLPSAVSKALEVRKYRDAEKVANEALLESERRLQQAQKMEAIGTLTGGVAHDFNNLLMSILGNTQLALRKLETDHPVRNRVEEIGTAAKKAAELTSKLLAYSRRQHLERRTIDLNHHTAEIMRLLERVIGATVQVSVQFENGLPAVYADPAQIEQVIMNLSINARDAMPNGGKLRIETSSVRLDEEYCIRFPYVQPGDYVRIQVKDNGTGIDSETLQHIYEPFFTTKEQGKGTGLGLSMAYGIVKQHEGYIHVDSQVGIGTTFDIFLPVDTRNIPLESAASGELATKGSATILVAEDEEALRTVARDALEDLGYTVLLAKDGADAVEIFSRNSNNISLLLFDVIMPRMGGIAAYERISEIKPDLPLILMTGYSSETVQSPFIKTEKSSDDIGAPVIQKPYDLDVLGRKVHEVLNTSQKRFSLTQNPSISQPTLNY